GLICQREIGETALHIVSTFEHSTYLELALTALEESGVTRENILTIPVKKRKIKRKFMDTIHLSDGISLLDLSMALATALSVIGVSFGFRLKWGPIIWGLIGAIVGGVVGFSVKWLFYQYKHSKESRVNRKSMTEVVVLIECKPEQAEKIEEILWDY